MHAKQLVLNVLFIFFSCVPCCIAIKEVDTADKELLRSELHCKKLLRTEGSDLSLQIDPAKDTCAHKADSPNTDSDSDLQTPYKYVGNRYSHKFHLLDCPFAQAMSSWNTEYFCTRKEAIEHGEKPCHWCLPAWWKSVSAIIVGSSSTSDISNTSNIKGLSVQAALRPDKD